MRVVSRPLGGGANDRSAFKGHRIAACTRLQAAGAQWLPVVVSVVTMPVRIDSEHAIHAADDAASSATNDPAHHTADRSQHPVTGMSTPVGSIVNSAWHALRLGGEWSDKNDAKACRKTNDH
jgi:hypothetical protein